MSPDPATSPVPPCRITLLTDFGTADGYAAAMRGVIAALLPGALVDDVSHDIAPGDVHAAAWALARYWTLYPEGTVHVVVVDPGVGSGRRGVVVEACARFGVGPDNGALTPMLEAEPRGRAHHITNAAVFRAPVSTTFHGRDIFAPVAAYLARHGSVDEVGPIIDDAARLSTPPAQRAGSLVRGVVVHVDRFGNLITNVPADWARDARDVALAGRPIGRVRQTYADVSAGEPVALIGSSGLLEIAVRQGDAARTLGASRGAEVTLRMR